MADLVFNISEALLTGNVDGVYISSRAHSGGRGGSTRRGVQNYFLVDNPFATRVKLDSSNPDSIGGTLPMGFYSLRMHEKKPNMIRLIPAAGSDMKGRDGLLIHGRGKRGSDGCIVPGDFNIVLKLCELVRARQRNHGADITLQVLAAGTDVDRKLREWRSIA